MKPKPRGGDPRNETCSRSLPSHLGHGPPRICEGRSYGAWIRFVRIVATNRSPRWGFLGAFRGTIEGDAFLVSSTENVEEPDILGSAGLAAHQRAMFDASS